MSYSVIAPADALKDEEQIRWDEWSRVEDRTIDVRLLLGTQRCYGASATLAETATTVTVTVVGGTLPDAPGMCTDEARFVALRLTLAGPLDGRSVVDGAGGLEQSPGPGPSGGGVSAAPASSPA